MKSVRLVALALTALCTCGGTTVYVCRGMEPYTTPRKVLFVTHDASYPSAMVDGLRDAIDDINNAIGCSTLAYGGPSDKEHAGQIHAHQRKEDGGQAHVGKNPCDIYIGNKMPDAFFESIAVHEILHCLGQDHVSPELNPGDVMNPVVGWDWSFGPYMCPLRAKYCKEP